MSNLREKAVIITNPPYGERISTNDLLGLYSMIGERLKHAFTGNTAWILSYREECFDQIGLKPTAKIPLFNGALECEFRKYEIFDGKYKEFKKQESEEGNKEYRPYAAREFKTQKEESLNPERKENSSREREENSNRMINGSSSLVNTENRQTENGNRSENLTESENLIKNVNRESFGNGTTNGITTETVKIKSYEHKENR